MTTPFFDDTAHPRGQAHNAGQFRIKQNAAPAASLSRPRASDFPEVRAVARLQRWDDRDNLVEIASENIDLAEVLDGLALEDLPADAGDTDQLDSAFFAAQHLGLVDDGHDGPFDVDVDDFELEEYREARKQAGQEEPVKNLPSKSPAERKELFNRTLLDHLPSGGVSAVAMWNGPQASAWVRDARTALAQQVAQGRLQPEFLDREDTAIFERVQAAALVSFDNHRDTDKIRETAYRLYEHLASTRW